MKKTELAPPKVTLGQYKDLPVTRRVRPVSEKAVELETRTLARNNAPFRPVSDPAQRGCRVTLDFEGFLDGNPIPDSKMEQVTVLLGTGQLMPAAEEAVYGHCAGETFRFDFTYPEDFRVEELSGKTAQFEIRLHTVEQKTVLPPDDELAKSLGFDSLDALQNELRRRKQESHEANADRLARSALLNTAGANLIVDLPQDSLDLRAEAQMRELEAKLKKSGITLDFYCEKSSTTPQELREGFRREAERQMRCMLAVRAIAEAENITVLNEEVDAEYARLSKQHDTPEEEIRKVISRDAIAAALTNLKVQQFLLDHANVTSVVEKE